MAKETMTMKQQINKIVSEVSWFYMNCEDRCKGCGVYRWKCGPHEDDCPYGKLIEIVEKADV